MKAIITHPNFDSLFPVESLPADTNLVSWKSGDFADGWPNLFINDVRERVEHREVTYVGDFSQPEEFFRNYAAIRGLLDYYADKVRVVIPYFPVGTMERISKKGEVATAKYFADILSTLPPGRTNKTSIHIFDLHALTERFFFDSARVNAELHSAMDLIKREIPKDTVIVFPDDGAAKRFAEEFAGYETIVCAKVRDGNGRKVTVKEGDPKGKRVIIIDDLIQTGGTIIEAAKVLTEMGATQVDAFATHGVFPNDSHVRVAAALGTLYTTDTIPANHARSESVSNMRVFSIRELIDRIISR